MSKEISKRIKAAHEFFEKASDEDRGGSTKNN